MDGKFSDRERAVLALVQGDLPDSLEPYADLAGLAGVSEDEVLSLLSRLKASGAIRRFGATIRHQRAGWPCNAMIVWPASEAEAARWGPLAARHPRVSHVYYRPSSASDWPSALYTMAHGRTEGECLSVVDDLMARWPLREHLCLRSLRELKKTSMKYF